MDEFDVINDNEIRIVGDAPAQEEQIYSKRHGHKWLMISAIILFTIIICWILFCMIRCGANDHDGAYYANRMDTTNMDRTSYVVISDTVINNISLHCFTPINAKPKLVVGLLSQIPPQYVLGAMAADFGLYGGEYQVVGSFVQHGKMLSHSKSKYGFCAILKDTVVIGNSLSTSFFEQAIEEHGDFFRQYALVEDGETIKNPPTHKDALRRALCVMSDGRLCVIDTDMEVSLDNFSNALCDYGIRHAVSLMGSGAAVRWAVDRAGRRYIAGADEYEFPDVVNYIVWE